MNSRRELIEESIFKMIAEIEKLRKHIIRNSSYMRYGKQAIMYYLHLKIGMCLSLIDSYRELYKLDSWILFWYKDNQNRYTELRSYVYERMELDRFFDSDREVTNDFLRYIESQSKDD